MIPRRALSDQCRQECSSRRGRASSRTQPRTLVEPTFLVPPLRGSNGLLTPTHRSRGGLSNFAPPPSQNAQKRRMFGDPGPALVYRRALLCHQLVNNPGAGIFEMTPGLFIFFLRERYWAPLRGESFGSASSPQNRLAGPEIRKRLAICFVNTVTQKNRKVSPGLHPPTRKSRACRGPRVCASRTLLEMTNHSGDHSIA
jgi:hypothetical protein